MQTIEELIKKSSAHWELVLNRPEKYNAITQPMYERYIEILDQAAQDKQLVLLSITAKGKFYSSGTDLADFAKWLLLDGVFASSRATFSLPFTRTAQSAVGCSSLVFPSLMGSLHAKDVLLFDRKLTAQEAEKPRSTNPMLDQIESYRISGDGIE
ncbi:hypothetical protein I4U23_017361 [Adineta vaga]|nr:hypothetical protein I4U23_017361 [Adineta vaga]